MFHVLLSIDMELALSSLLLFVDVVMMLIGKMKDEFEGSHVSTNFKVYLLTI